ncbi:MULTISPECIES: FecCD family ABC transporter permease [unclassified Streptomyces]|uniref:FecCD family ABC transporter permease n=1 Tax=unclassified Streptomyces TaxID=2593676 RepID=UPI00099BF44A|nr:MULTISPECIES: iron ABC transporter permease [unclassified Streptomyces]
MPQTHAPRADVPRASGPRSLPPASPDTAAELKSATVARLRAAHRTGIRRARLVTCVLALMLFALLVASILLGGVKRIPAGDILPAAFGMRTGLADYVIFRIRMPRALAALLAGALFGLSGALYQRLVRNPLATPDMIGISAGAGAGATTMLLFAPAVPFGTSLAGIGGAFVLVAAVLALSRRGGGVDTYRLVLVGIGLSAVCTAYVNYLFTVAGQHGIAQVMRWLVGSVNDATWDGVSTLAGALAVCGLCTALLSRSLGSMALGDQLALGLGTRVGTARIATLLVGAAAAALATSVTGPIGFVSLISGPIATRLVGADRSVALAVPIGAVIVLGADVLAQHGPLISPVPTGVLTALLGAPYFVWLILRCRQGATA